MAFEFVFPRDDSSLYECRQPVANLCDSRCIQRYVWFVIFLFPKVCSSPNPYDTLGIP